MGQLLISTGLLLVLVQPVTGACKNLLSPIRNVTLYDGDNKPLETLTKCKDLVGRHPILCNEEYGEEDGLCCKACRNKDTSCVDNTLTFWGVGDQYFGCADYVNMYPCECKNNQVKQKCCKSCQKAECKDCDDYLSTFQWITVFDSDGNPVTNLTDCDTLVTNYLYLCKKKYGEDGGHCCESCSNQDLNCIDENIFWGEDKQSCEEYVAEDPCRCESKQVAAKCCASCQGTVCDTCRDYLSQNQWIDIQDSEGNVKERLTNCTNLIKDYLYLCKKKYGMAGGHCCDSCSPLDLSCIDDTSLTWYMNNKEMKCEEYVKMRPRACMQSNVMSTCCDSCKKQEELCVDTDAKTTVKLAVGVPKEIIKCKKCSCAEISSYGEEFTRKACKNKKIQKRCCKMCQEYIP